MTVKQTLSNQPVGDVPAFEVSEDLTGFLRAELSIDADDEARSRLRWIVRNFMADTKRQREAHPVSDLRSTLEKLRGSAVELLSNLQAEPAERRRIVRQLLVSAAGEPTRNDASEDADDASPLSDKRHFGQVIDEVQVSLLLLSRASNHAIRSLEDAGSSQPGGYASAWRMFVPDLKSWVEDNGGVWKMPRNDTDKTLEYRSTSTLEFVKMILAALPQEPVKHADGLVVDYRVPIHSDQALAQRIKRALRSGDA